MSGRTQQTSFSLIGLFIPTPPHPQLHPRFQVAVVGTTGCLARACPPKALLSEPGTADLWDLSPAKDEREELSQSPRSQCGCGDFNPGVGTARRKRIRLPPSHLPLAAGRGRGRAPKRYQAHKGGLTPFHRGMKRLCRLVGVDSADTRSVRSCLGEHTELGVGSKLKKQFPDAVALRVQLKGRLRGPSEGQVAHLPLKTARSPQLGWDFRPSLFPGFRGLGGRSRTALDSGG